MKHILLTMLLLLGAAGATNLSAQSSLGGFNEDHYNDIGFVFESSENMKQDVVLPR